MKPTIEERLAKKSIGEIRRLRSYMENRRLDIIGAVTDGKYLERDRRCAADQRFENLIALGRIITRVERGMMSELIEI